MNRNNFQSKNILKLGT